MTTMTKTIAVGWFEIPVSNLGRAKKFYETVFELKLSTQNYGPVEMEKFPWEQGASGAPGALVKADGYTPSRAGPLVYFPVEDINTALGRIKKSGGKELMPKTSMGGYGFIATFEDTEGNRVGLLSR